MKAPDLSGQKFGRLTVTATHEVRAGGNMYWLCECECGNSKWAAAQKLKSGSATSCGCTKSERAIQAIEAMRIDLKGMRFGKWTVLERIDGSTPAKWLCRCDCGITRAVLASSLRKGVSKSCGCEPHKKPTQIKPRSKRVSDDDIANVLSTANPNYIFLGSSRVNGCIKVHIQCDRSDHLPYWTSYATIRDCASNSLGCPECLRIERATSQAKYTVSDVKRILDQNDMEFVNEPDTSTLIGYVQYRCKRCGHISSARPIHLLNGRQCRNCLGLLPKTPEEYRAMIAKQDSEYEVLGDYVRSNTPILFRHTVCGNEYMVSPNNFQGGKRCPRCKFSRGERAVEEFLNSHNIEFRAQYTFDDCRRKRELRFDFYVSSMNTCIEFQGRQHYESVGSWGGEDALLIRQECDEIKRQYCSEHNIHLVEIFYYDIDRVDEILARELNLFETRDFDAAAGHAC